MKKVILALILACLLGCLFGPTVFAAGPPDNITVTTYNPGPPVINTDGSGPPSRISIQLPPCGSPFPKDVINIHPSISPPVG